MKDDASKKTLKQIKQRDKDVEAFKNRFENWLGKSLNKTLKDLKKGNVKAAEAANILGSLETNLRDLGLNEQLKEIEALYGDELRAVKQQLKSYVKAGEPLLGGSDVTLANTLIDFDTSAADKSFTSYIGDMKSAIMRGVLGGEQIDIDAIQDKFGSQIANYVGTELRTGLSAFNQTVSNTKAEELGLELWLYIGPEDEVTRDFCQAVLDKEPPIYTTEERAALNSRADAPPGMPVEVYGGGYNCRHEWVPIDLETAQSAYGYKGEGGEQAAPLEEEATQEDAAPEVDIDEYFAKLKAEQAAHEATQLKADEATEAQKPGNWRMKATVDTKTKAYRAKTTQLSDEVESQARSFAQSLNSGALGRDVASAVEDWFGTGYAAMRRALKNNSGGENWTRAKNAEKGIAAAPKYEGTAYRGMYFSNTTNRTNFLNGISAAGEWTESQMASYSRSPEIARGFAKIKKGTWDDKTADRANSAVIIELEAKGKSVHAVEYASAYQSEKEVIAITGTRYKLVDMVYLKKFDTVVVKVQEQ